MNLKMLLMIIPVIGNPKHQKNVGQANVGLLNLLFPLSRHVREDHGLGIEEVDSTVLGRRNVVDLVVAVVVVVAAALTLVELTLETVLLQHRKGKEKHPHFQ